MKKAFFVSTPIYYPSGKLHIGHTYTTTLSDVVARYKKENGYDVFFLTGSDEHGQKIEQKAIEAGVTPKVYVDKIVTTFKELWTNLDIDYDRFIRTTDSDHYAAVQKLFSQLLEQNLIYPAKYKGKYCVSCEEFLTSEQMDENFTHVVCHQPAIDFEEETYMLKVSEFRDYLVELFKNDFLVPEARKKEMLNNFINNNLEDLSVTRVSFDWGVKVLENPKHVIYVWLDALSNYITALGWGSADTAQLEKFWTNGEVLQFVGKEITRFHSIYWPVMLKALGLKAPDKLLSHGWILSKDTKMSKSLGNVIDPVEIINTYGSDALRFYIANNLPIDKDGNFTDELFIEAFNVNLANNVGNLISRVSNMIIKYFDGQLPKVDTNQFATLIAAGEQSIVDYQTAMDAYNICEATQVALKLGNDCNKFIEEAKPWALEKEGKLDELAQVLSVLQKNIMIIAYLLKPILVKNYSKMVSQMGVAPEAVNWESLKTHNFNYQKITTKEVLFERIK